MKSPKSPSHLPRGQGDITKLLVLSDQQSKTQRDSLCHHIRSRKLILTLEMQEQVDRQETKYISLAKLTLLLFCQLTNGFSTRWYNMKKQFVICSCFLYLCVTWPTSSHIWTCILWCFDEVFSFCSQVFWKVSSMKAYWLVTTGVYLWYGDMV